MFVLNFAVLVGGGEPLRTFCQKNMFFYDNFLLNLLFLHLLQSRIIYITTVISNLVYRHT
jgi:hypothetical protein